MSDYSSRTRVMTALDHQEPDRVPFDCSFSYKAYLRIRDYLGYQSTGDIQPGNPSLSVCLPVDFLEELGVDLFFMGLSRRESAPLFEYGREFFTDEWGVKYRRIENPTGISYEVVEHPLANATIKDLEDYRWPDPYDPSLTADLEEKARDLFENTEFALVGRFNNSIFEQAFMLRGMEQLFIDMVSDPEFVFVLMDKLTDLAIGHIESGLKACGKYLQILRLAGDDMGHQRGTLLSPAMFRKIIKPRFERLYKTAKSDFLNYNPNGKMMAHTDGDVYAIIPDYIEMGLDILNPVQPYVTCMEHEKLKREFGDKLSFHGGIDLQHVMPFGTPEEVRGEAVKIMLALGSMGGYILAPTHYLLPDVPPENVIALRDAVMKYGKYPLSG